VNSGLLKLLSTLSVKVNERIYKVRDASTDVEEVHNLIFEFEVHQIWHVIFYMSKITHTLYIDMLT
jgi:hypothetical protein